MKNPKVLVVVLVVLLLLAGGAAYSVFRSTFYSGGGAQTETPEEDPVELLPVVDDSVVVSVERAAKADTVILSVKGMDGNMSELEYELTYESEGLIKGVNSGTKPLDVSGKDDFEREIYLGTCSRNVCKPDPGVTKVSVALVFTDASGSRSQFTGDFDL